MTLNSFLQLEPEYRDYVWGRPFASGHSSYCREVSVVWEEDRVRSGDLAGRTLREIYLNLAHPCSASGQLLAQERDSPSSYQIAGLRSMAFTTSPPE